MPSPSKLRAPRETTVAASLVIDYFGYFQRRGISTETLCRAAGIEAVALDDPNARLPGSHMERLWTAGEHLTSDPDLGLHTAESYNPGALNILGYVILSCRTASEALDRLSRYAPILNDGLRVRTVVQGDTTRYVFEAVEGSDNFIRRSPRQVMEVMACGVVNTMRQLTKFTLEPISVSFRHTAPAATNEHTRLLGPAVAFDQSEDCVTYSSSGLNANLVSANPELRELFETQAKALLSQIDRQGEVSRRVLDVLADRIKGTAPSLEEVAVILAMSDRTLQRELRNEQTSFRELVDVVRREIAVQQLAQPGNSAAEVGFLLGFSDPSAFTRAFRRWTGTAPAAFRSA